MAALEAAAAMSRWHRLCNTKSDLIVTDSANKVKCIIILKKTFAEYPLISWEAEISCLTSSLRWNNTPFAQLCAYASPLFEHVKFICSLILE